MIAHPLDIMIRIGPAANLTPNSALGLASGFGTRLSAPLSAAHSGPSLPAALSPAEEAPSAPSIGVPFAQHAVAVETAAIPVEAAPIAAEPESAPQEAVASVDAEAVR